MTLAYPKQELQVHNLTERGGNVDGSSRILLAVGRVDRIVCHGQAKDHLARVFACNRIDKLLLDWGVRIGHRR